MQLTNGPGGNGLPHLSPVDGTLAFVSDRALQGRMSLFLKDDHGERPVGELAGTIEDMRWAPDGGSLIVMAADRGLDGGATNGAQRLTRGEPEDPAVTSPANARRRLFRVRVDDGSTVEVGPSKFSVWEFELVGDDAALAVVSVDPSERGWYHAELTRIDLATGAATILHRARWQLLAPAADPSGKRIAFLDGWSSDRGLVASEISILDIATGKIITVAPSGMSSITSMKWRDDDSLWFTGWSRLGSVYGVTHLDGSVEWMTQEDAIIGTSSFSAGITTAPDSKGFAAVRESDGAPPEIVFTSGAKASAWSAVSNLNGDVARDFNAYPEVRAVAWKGADGVELEGLVLLPRDGAKGPRPTIVDIHGGPSWAVRHAYNPGDALPFATAGYAVFLPNYRGNVGWGKAFGMLNVGDPAGAEFQDILAGLDKCVTAGISDPDRLGITGASYGGYLTAWAVATTNRFKAAVMVSGFANQLSSHYSCKDFHAFINGGPLSEERYRRVAVDRSAITRLDRPTTPTLMMHGEGDRCTPLGQAQELYAALLERGVESELVVYPREGHGLRERDHQLEAWRRMIGWFDRYLGSPR
ncbi:S9 family peptidase [Mesorhizobium kowhaii]|uniref:S9 family peptidase n=1 Tax=Mesorhizobium kowhaii TaxID=1300272 RepID=UPI00142D7295|nr:S9 family peptidase [Mesorhizobium kowhaii]